MENSLQLQCKVCERKYALSLELIDTIPIWNLENCSRRCYFTCSAKKILNSPVCSIKPQVI